jgi:hypothetical protein
MDRYNSSMHPSAAVIVATLALCMFSAARAQVFPGPDSASAESIARYRVEVIAFAHADFDPQEEIFELEVPRFRVPDAPLKTQRTYVDELMKLSLYRQIGTDIVIPEPQRVLPHYANDFLAIETFADETGEPEALEFRLLERDELALGDKYRIIQRLGAYQPLAHGGWVQDALAQEEALEFRFSNLGVVSPRGTLKLYVSRFLHLVVDLSYYPHQQRLPPFENSSSPFPSPAAESTPRPTMTLEEIDLPLSYRLRAERRTLRDELAYIDHPAFGILVRITLEPADEPGTSAADASTGPAA